MNYANTAFGLYMEHSYRYYVMDLPVISDAVFDSLCRVLVECWDEVTHRYKHMADISALQAGTGYQFTADNFPKGFARLIECTPNRNLCEVYNVMAFADEHERKAHDIICIIKFGGCGGVVSNQLLKQVGDYLRGGPIRKALPLPLPKPALPKPALPKPRMPQ